MPTQPSSPSSVSHGFTSPRFSLAAMLAAVTGCCLLFAAVGVLGFWVVGLLLLAACAPLALLLAWGWALWRAPVLVKNATVLLLFGAALAALLPCWLLQSRDEARRNQTLNQLRRIGFEFAEQQQLHPGIRQPTQENRTAEDAKDAEKK